MKTKQYYIWDNNQKIRAFIRKPKNFEVKRLQVTTAEERKIGLRWIEVK